MRLIASELMAEYSDLIRKIAEPYTAYKEAMMAFSSGMSMQGSLASEIFRKIDEHNKIIGKALAASQLSSVIGKLNDANTRILEARKSTAESFSELDIILAGLADPSIDLGNALAGSSTDLGNALAGLAGPSTDLGNALAGLGGPSTDLRNALAGLGGPSLDLRNALAGLAGPSTDLGNALACLGGIHDSWRPMLIEQENLGEALAGLAEASFLPATRRLNLSQYLLSQVDIGILTRDRNFREVYTKIINDDILEMSNCTNALSSSFVSPADLFRLPVTTIPGATREVLTTSMALDSLIQPREDDEYKKLNFSIEEIESEVDECESLLMQINHNLVLPYRGAQTALVSKGPDYQRHFLISLREMFTHLLQRLAPDDKVRNWEPDNNNEVIYHKKGTEYHITRRGRILYVCRKINCAPLSDFVDADIKTYLGLFDVLQRTHELSPDFTRNQLEMLLLKAKSIVVYFAKLWEQSNN